MSLALVLGGCAKRSAPPCTEAARSSSAAPSATKPAVQPLTDAALAARHHVDMTVSVADLVASYRADAERTDARYTGKRVRILGAPLEVRADAQGGPVVVLTDRATGTTQNFHYSSEAHADAGQPSSPARLAEAIFYEEYTSEVSRLTQEKPAVVNCRVLRFSADAPSVRLVGCSLADVSVYSVCRRMLRFNCLLPGWTDDTRVPFFFTGVRWNLGVNEKKVAEAWIDDGRAPLAPSDFDPGHTLSPAERRYADRVLGMFIRADSQASYERDVSALNGKEDAGGRGRRHAEDPSSRIYVMFPPDGESKDQIEQGQRETTEAHARQVIHGIPQTEE